MNTYLEELLEDGSSQAQARYKMRRLKNMDRKNQPEYLWSTLEWNVTSTGGDD
jgi:hypothetical protein